MGPRRLLAVAATFGLLAAVSPPAAGAAVLVHWWKADGDYTDAVAGNDGSPVGDTTFGPGQSGQAFSFDGDDDYVSVPDATSHHFAGSFSVDAWAQTTSAAVTQTIAVYYDCAQFCPNNPSIYWLGINQGRARGVVRDADAGAGDLGQDVVGGPALADGRFHRITLIRDVDAGKLSLWVDGVLAAEEDLEAQADGPITNADFEADPLTIGTQFEGGTTTPVADFAGLVDEVRLWDGALFEDGVVIFGSDLTRDPLAPPARQCTQADPGPCTDVALSFHSGNLYPAQAPISGVITSVRYRSNTADQATLRLARLDEFGDATGAGTGPTVITEMNGAITEVPVDPGLPVQEGDYLAGEGSTTTAFNCDNVGGSFDLYLPPLADGGAFRQATTSNPLCEILVQATIEPDADADGFGDASQDNCPGLSNDGTDTDGDAQGDACDADDDNDGVVDGADNCQLVRNPGQRNTDGDLQGDACDADDDGDGVVDAGDSCAVGEVGWNSGPATDVDADGCRDNSEDADDDGDGLADGADNCPLAANASQADGDGDGLGDACDLIAGASGQVPPPPELVPELGELLVARAVSGTVTIAFPRGFVPARTARGLNPPGARAGQKGLDFIPLEQAREIPVGSFLNTRRGTVSLTAARDATGRTQSGRFSRGLFQVLQSRNRRARGLTEVRLKGSSFAHCRTDRTRGRASATRLSRRTIRRLRSDANGRFRTRGRHSAATVRGTVWTTADRCDGTLTTVKRGRVAVRDLRRKRTIVVRAGKSYLAQPR